MESKKKPIETLLDEASNIDLDSVEWPGIETDKEIIEVGQASKYSKKLYIRIYRLDDEIKELKIRFDAIPDTTNLELPPNLEVNSRKHQKFLEKGNDNKEEKKNLEETISYLEDRFIELISHWKQNIRLNFKELKHKPEIGITEDGKAYYEKYAIVEVDSIIDLVFKTIENPNIVEEDIS